MADPDFIHLRVHSSYSLSEGAITPKDLVELCQKYTMPAVAISDTSNMFGSLEFSDYATKGGVQPIIGSIINLEMPSGPNSLKKDFSKLLLIAKNKTGYSNLLKIVSFAYLKVPENDKPHTNIERLKEYSDGIICLTGCTEGPIGSLLLENREKDAEIFTENLLSIFGDNLYIELIRTGLAEQAQIEDSLINLAYKFNIPLVATNDVYFKDLGMHEAHDALLCIAEARFQSETNRRKVSQESYFKSQRSMKDLFSDIPEALANTVNIAKRCSVFSKKKDPMLPTFSENEEAELEKVAKEGLQKRLYDHVLTPDMDEEKKQKLIKLYNERIDYELGVIIKMGFPGYFLIVSDFIRWSKKNNIPVGPGRGSGAGSVVAWALEITDLDPIRFGLLFERFLNPERVSMPDFDVDFCQERREEVIKYVQQKYGYEKVAQIITFGKLQARAVLRDVGRVLQMPYGQIDKISKMIPFNPIDPVSLSKAIEMDKVLQKMQKEDREISKLLDIGLKLEGLNRHASTHAAGVVIGKEELYNMVPVYRDPRSDMPVCGYSMKYSEMAGLVKFDFLGLKTLTVISKACQLIKAKGEEIDISKIPLDDKKSFEMLSSGDSVGVFQIESAGMRDTLRKLRPDNIEDIIALISLYRPGPMDNIPSYIARKHGLEEPDYLDPMLTDILRETYGVIIYQEQVMQIAQVMGGYTLGGADLLRRAMGKKIAAEMDAQRKIFVEGAIKNGVDKDKASSIFDLVAKFAGYGFNKSHAAAYALISYQTAYLKANHPVEFLAASMNLEIHDTDKINSFRQEILRNKIEFLPPDINKSFAYFKPEKLSTTSFAIRYGLGALKNVSVALMEEVEKERKNGFFKDIFDFVIRMGNTSMNKRQLENLVKSGAFDSISSNRRQLFENIETILRYGSTIAAEKNSAQASLFGDASSSNEQKPTLTSVDDWKGVERLNNEFEAMGLYLGEHPLSSYKESLEKKGFILASEMGETLKDGISNVKIAGVVTSKRMRSSPRGRFATVIMSDPKGIFELSVYDEELLSDSRDILDTGFILMINAEVRKDEGGIRITAREIKELDEFSDKRPSSVNIVLNGTKEIDKLKSLIKKDKNNSAKVTITYHLEEEKISIFLPDDHFIHPANHQEISSLACVSVLEEA